MNTQQRVRPHKDMTGADLAVWRSQRPGEHAFKNNQTRPGWTQERAANWYGVSERQWSRYETSVTGIPLSLVKRLIAHESSFDDTINRMWDTTPEKIEEYGGIHPELAHEKGMVP